MEMVGESVTVVAFLQETLRGGAASLFDCAKSHLDLL